MKGKKGAGDMGKTFLVVIIVGALIVWGFSSGVFKSGSTAPSGTQTVVPASAGSAGCTLAPSYTYLGNDAFNGETLTTSYGGVTVQAKVNGNRPTTSTAPVAGQSLQLWLQQTTNYTCEVVSTTADCGNQQLQTPCYRQGAPTLTVYSEPAHTSQSNSTLTGTGAVNTSIAANGQATFTLTIQGTAKQFYAPLGGCLFIEVPSSVTSVSVGGLQAGCPYPVTYSVSSTSNIYKSFTIPKGFDSGDGNVDSLTIQVQNGGTDITNSNMVLKILPANNYIDLNGNFQIGIEKDKNADTTRVGLGSPTAAIALI